MAFPDRNATNAVSMDDDEQPDQDNSDYAECEAKIAALTQRVSAIEAKLGIQSPDDSSDGLKQAIASTKPFGGGSGQTYGSNS